MKLKISKSVASLLALAVFCAPVVASASNIITSKFLLLGSVISVANNSAVVHVAAASKSAAPMQGRNITIPLRNTNVTGAGLQRTNLTAGQSVKVRGISTTNVNSNTTKISKTRWIQVVKPTVRATTRVNTAPVSRPVTKPSGH